MSPLDNAMQVIENLRSINAQLTTERDELRAEIEHLKRGIEVTNAAALAWMLRHEDAKLQATELQALKSKLEGGVRVYAFDAFGHMQANQFGGKSNATLLIDDGAEI